MYYIACYELYSITCATWLPPEKTRKNICSNFIYSIITQIPEKSKKKFCPR